MESEIDVLDALASSSLFYFVGRAFNHLHQGSDTRFHPGWHIEAMCHALEKVISGEEPKLIITMPPRHLKSISASVALPAYVLGHVPSTEFLVASYGDKLAAIHSQHARSIIKSDFYKRLFPRTRLIGERALDFETSAGGFRAAVTPGGAVTGRGADYLIIDDLSKAADANSPVERERVKDYYTQTLFSRLNDKQKPRIIVIQQRLHEDDLVGFLLELGTFAHLNLRAIAEEDETFQLGDGRVYHRRKGEALCPKLEPLGTLKKIQREMLRSAFAAQYQQNPVPPGGNRISWEWWKVYDRPFRREDYQYLAQSWDTAHSEEPKSSYSVCTTWGYQAPYWYLLDVHRGRHAYHELLKIALRLHRQWQPDCILIEKAASGHSLISDLRNTHKLRAEVRPRPVTADKESRFEAQMAKIESGSFFLPKEASWLEEFKREFLAFPRGRYDDQVDSVTQFLEWVGAHRGGAAIISRRNYNPPASRAGGMADWLTIRDRSIEPTRAFSRK